MLSYQHGYHAGCFADVVKHTILCQILTYMAQKDKPMMYLDTHAGRGQYDLLHPQAQKTGEALMGVHMLWPHRHVLPDVFSPYIQTLQSFNTQDKLHYYPGSPAFALQLLRPHDRHILCELHPTEHAHLEQLSTQKKRVFLFHEDGLKQLQAVLPPIERRGLVFIDPSYELPQDYKNLGNTLQKAHQRFSTAVYCIWYPLIDQRRHMPLLRKLSALQGSHLQIEFDYSPRQHTGMTGTGLWIINPPYTLEQNAQETLKTLTKYINKGGSSYRILKNPVYS